MNGPEVLNKPSYSVPNMAAIAAIPWNGYCVISTFSGCGGSCLGFEMAGFKVIWASEFIPAAQEVYRLNHPDVHLNTQDIRDVTPESILATVGLRTGEVDVLEGSPPCASFSMVGNRAKDWGKVKPYSDTKQRTDDLFSEYARILKGIQPKVFIAENVLGLVRGVAKGYFKRILAELKSCGYNVRCQVLDAQWLGVPQVRKRVIFIGVREDLGIDPVFPKPLPYYYSVRDALPWVKSQTKDFGFGKGAMINAIVPSGTIGTGPNHGNGLFPPSIIEAETDISRFAIGREWEKLRPGKSSDRYLNLVKPLLEKPSPTVTVGGSRGSATVTHPTEKRRFSIAGLKRICAFPADFQLTGSYLQQWERLGRAVPPVMMRAVAESIRDGILGQIKV